MSIVEHKNPVESRATAPYNFVPPPDRVLEWEAPPARDKFHTDRLHGSLEIEVTTETQVYTRCAYPVRFEDADVKDTPERQSFYHWGNEAIPILPGSSLRGCIRNLVEILSYSRLSRKDPKEARVSDTQLMYRAVADQNTSVGKAYNAKFLKEYKDKKDHRRKIIDFPSSCVRAGYLEKGENGGWAIRPSLTYEGESFVRVNDSLVSGAKDPNSANRRVWVQPARRQCRPKGDKMALNYAVTNGLQERAGLDLQPGTLVVSGPMNNKHMHTVVYERDPAAKVIPITATMWKLYEEDRDLKRGIANRKLGKVGDVVFYLVDNKGQLEFFGPNLFFRLPYDLNPTELLVDDFDPEKLDFAESIFGTVMPKPTKGRVTFSDGEPEPGQTSLISQQAVYPEILSTPKPTSYQNYLVQSDDRKEHLKSYIKGDQGKTTLRGFKRYWHRGREECKAALHRDDKPDQYTAIKPVRSGAKFTSTVHFENLTKEELGGLLTAIDLPESCRHHFGMGKPRGFGSIKISVHRVNLIDPMKRYQTLANDGFRTDAAEIAKSAKDAFTKRILEHVGASGNDLWQVPRLQELKCLMEWQAKPDIEDTHYLSPNNNGDKAILRGRDVLPSPSQVLNKKSLGARPIQRSGASSERLSKKAAPPNAQKLSHLLSLPKVEGLVVDVRGSDHLIEIDGVKVSLPHKILRKENKISNPKSELPEGARVAIRVLPKEKGGYHLAELIEIL